MKTIRLSLALLLSLTVSSLFAATYRVGNQSELINAIAAHKASGDASGVITLFRNIPLNQIIKLDYVEGLIIDGSYAQYGLNINRYATTPSYQGTVALSNCNNITLRNMTINTPAKRNNTVGKRAVSIENSDKIGLHNLVLQPSGAPEGAAAVLAYRSHNIGIQNVTISGFYGGGIVLRQVWGFLIKNNTIIDMNNGAALANKVSNVGIQVDSITGYDDVTCTNALLPESQYSNKGMITGNTLENLPGQGIFVHSANDVIIDNNDLTQIAGGQGCAGDCGGRAIYVQKGSKFWIRYNDISGVDNGGDGGGINAGSKDASDVWIQGNTIEYTGNSDMVSYTALGTHQGDWNGFGISVRERALVENNEVLHSSTYGILIQPNASEVTIRNNTVRWSVLDNIKAVAGFSYTGQFLLPADACAGEHWAQELGGPLRDIYMRDNFLADARYGHGVNVVTRNQSEMTKNQSRWDDAWSKYEVFVRNLSMHRNGSGVGIHFEQPTAPVGKYSWAIASSGYDGQATYARVENGNNLQRLSDSQVSWSNQLSLNLSHITYPTMSSNSGVITRAVY